MKIFFPPLFFAWHFTQRLLLAFHRRKAVLGLHLPYLPAWLVFPVRGKKSKEKLVRRFFVCLFVWYPPIIYLFISFLKNFRQLILILELYNPNDVHDYLMHIALKLCADKVSEVRWISFKLVRNHGFFVCL